MDKLPPELKINILENIESIADIKHVRLVSKDLAYYAADSLFFQVLVFMTESSFANLEAIARHALLRHKVCSLVFFPAVLEDRYSTEEAYLRQISEIQYLDGELVGFRFNHLGRLQLTADEKQAGHARCVSVCQEQLNLRSNGETRLRNAFSTLPKLDHVSTSFTEDYLNDGVFVDLPKTLQSILTDCHMPFGQHADGPYNPEDFFMLTRAIAGSGIHPRSLRLSNDPEGFDCGFLEMSDVDFSLASDVFSFVTSLILVLDHDDDHYLMDVLETGCCRRLLEKAPLKSLSIGIGSLRCALPILPSVLGTHTWQKLRRLTLDNVVVEGFELTTFLQRHTSSLRHLSLVCIFLSTGSWYDVFASLQSLGLQTLSLCGLSIPIPSLPDPESEDTISDPQKVWGELVAWLRRVPWSPGLEVRYIHGLMDWTL
ncbi:MAG: hypothetical protein Q9187_003169 [Circinaria calcarea]